MKTVVAGPTTKHDGPQEFCLDCNQLRLVRQHTCREDGFQHTEVYCAVCGWFIRAERKEL